MGIVVCVVHIAAQAYSTTDITIGAKAIPMVHVRVIQGWPISWFCRVRGEQPTVVPVAVIIDLLVCSAAAAGCILLVKRAARRMTLLDVLLLMTGCAIVMGVGLRLDGSRLPVWLDVAIRLSWAASLGCFLHLGVKLASAWGTQTGKV